MNKLIDDRQIIYQMMYAMEMLSYKGILEHVKQHEYSFLGVDRSYVVNILHVMSLKNQQIILRNGDVIPVSKPKLSYVKKEIACNIK